MNNFTSKLPLDSRIQECIKAIQGDYGFDQIKIVETGLDFVTTILRKNRNYGSSVFKLPILARKGESIDYAIRSRLSDKIERLISLLQGEEDLVGESLDDTITDCGAYCLLWLIQRKIDAPSQDDQTDNRTHQ